MATSPYLIEVATRHQVYLERLKAGEVNAGKHALAALEKGIRDVLAALDTDLPDLTQRELGALLRRLREKHTQVMTDELIKRLENLEKLAGYEAAFEAKALTLAVDGVLLTVPDARKAMALALRQPIQATGELLEPFLKGANEKQIAAINRLIRNGRAQGLTNQQMIRAVRGTKALNYRDGIMARLGRDAESVIRTAVQHVSQASRNMTWAANSDVINGYSFVATLDSLTTQQCRSLDGTTHELGRGPIPPLHVRCRSTTVASVDPKWDFLDAGATRSAEFGPVDSDLSYYEWLKRQPASFQDDAIGPTRGKLFRDGGLTADEFARLNLGRNFKPLTLEDMRKLEPHAFERAGLS